MPLKTINHTTTNTKCTTTTSSTTPFATTYYLLIYYYPFGLTTPTNAKSNLKPYWTCASNWIWWAFPNVNIIANWTKNLQFLRNFKTHSKTHTQNDKKRSIRHAAAATTTTRGKSVVASLFYTISSYLLVLPIHVYYIVLLASSIQPSPRKLSIHSVFCVLRQNLALSPKLNLLLLSPFWWF